MCHIESLIFETVNVGLVDIGSECDKFEPTKLGTALNLNFRNSPIVFAYFNCLDVP